MQLNTLSPAKNSKSAAKRLGRGQGSGLGKTCGRGHKGQKSRSGGFHKVGFEGGQMPLQMRLPKIGFKSAKSHFREELTLTNLNQFEDNSTVDLISLKNKGLVRKNCKFAKVILSGALSKAIHLQGIAATANAKKAIEDQGGSVTLNDSNNS